MTESKYSPDLAEAILHRVSEGSSLSEACRELGLSESTVRQWSRDNRCGFGAAYQQARALQLESWADRIIDTAKRTDIEAADKRVICDGYKWLLSKLRPERYGERLLVGSDPDHPIQHLHQLVSLRDLSTEALDALEAFCDRVIVEHAAVERSMPALLDQRQQ